MRLHSIKQLGGSLCLLALVGCASADRSAEGGPTGDGPGDTIEASAAGTGATSPTNDEYTPPPAAAAEAPRPSSPQATDALNQTLRRQDYDGLQKLASQMLSQNSNDAKALAALGVVNSARNKNLAALYFFNKSLAVNPNQPEVYTNMGIVQLALKDKREAIKAFKKALEVGSADGIAAANLGSIYATEGDYFKALPVLDRAVKAGIKDTRIYNNYGVALTANGRYEEAKEIYNQAIKLGSSNREAHFNLAILQIEHLNQGSAGLDTINKLRFLGLGEGMRDRINSLENKAKAGLK